MSIRIEIAGWVAASLFLLGCPAGDDGETAVSSTGMSGGTATTGPGSSGTTAMATSRGTAESGSSAADGPASESSASGPGSGSTSDADSGSSAESGTTGAVCVEEQGSCAQGEMCCKGLTCCIGVPVPPGEEYCGMECPDSDYELKREFMVVDADAVLEKVMALPITTWSYRRDDPSVRHLGPMAQDFKASFGLGASDKAIFQIDADGVALTSIQALTRRLSASEAENTALRESLARLQERVAALEAVNAPK